MPKIVEKEAAVVRMIYRMFLEGATVKGIASSLTEKKIPTPAGREVWHQSTVMSILQNEKYKGDAVLQKTFTVDFLTKKTKVNEGEVPQYYVENSHPAIVTPEVFDLVQYEIRKRKNTKGLKTGGGCFSGKIICGECGSFYGSKVWHSTSKYRRTIWQCNHKFKNKENCRTPHLYEEDLKAAFLEVFNSLIQNRDEILESYKDIIQTLTDTSRLDRENTKLLSEREVVLELLRKCVEDNARTALDQREYLERYTELEERLNAVNKSIEENVNKRQERMAKKESISEFIRMLEKNKTLLPEFDEELWNSCIEEVRVNSERRVVFVFRDGTEWEGN